MVGKFLYAYKDASEFTRPGVTRVCVEVDLTKTLPKELWIDNGGEMMAQKVVIPDGSVPMFCKKCMMLGHKEG